MSLKIKQYLKSLTNKNIHIIGASGSEGAAIIEFLIDNNITNISGHDFQTNLKTFRHRFKQTHTNLTAQERSTKLKKIINSPVKLFLRDKYLNGILEADIIFLTQGWYLYPPNFPLLQRAIDQKITISSLTKLYFDLAPCPIIGVTGSNGKTTTTTLITKLLRAGGYNVFTAGNERSIYKQILPNIHKIKSSDILVLEISNRQLTIDLKSSPHTSVLTNIYPNHIAEHKSYKTYQETKFSLFRYQNKSDFAILNYDNSIIKKNLNLFKAKIIPFSLKQKLKNGLYIKSGQIFYQNKPLLHYSNPYLANKHNQANVLAALAAILEYKISPTLITNVLDTFHSMPHRLEKIAEIDGVDFIDDLKSSTPTSTISAINSFPDKNIHLICGGNHKDVSHKTLAKTINQKVTTLFLLPGTTSKCIKKEILSLDKPHKVTIFEYPDVTAIIKNAFEIAKKGDIILMSPAGANFQEAHLKNKFTLKSVVSNICSNRKL